MLPNFKHIAVACFALIMFCIPLMGCSNDESRGYPPCITEDSESCYWDGDTRGNKTGVSFINTATGVIYLEG